MRFEKGNQYRKGLKPTNAFGKYHVPWNKGKKGMQVAWNKGTKGIMKKSLNAYKFLEDEQNHNWKGNKVGYYGLHAYIRRRLGNPSKCEHCETTKGQFEWANKSREYNRNLNDWIRLCIKCHDEYDEVGKKISFAKTIKTIII